MPTASFKVDENSTGWKAIQRMLDNLRSGESYVKAGVTGTEAVGPREDGGDEGLTNAQLASILEFGAPAKNIPPRPFINGTFALNRDKYLALMKAMLPKVYLTQISIPTMLKVVGEKMASDMRMRMVEGEGIPPPNAPSTLRRKMAKGKWNKKGKAASQVPKPLIDTGRLRQSITYQVVIKGNDK